LYQYRMLLFPLLSSPSFISPSAPLQCTGDIMESYWHWDRAYRLTSALRSKLNVAYSTSTRNIKILNSFKATSIASSKHFIPPQWNTIASNQVSRTYASKNAQSYQQLSFVMAPNEVYW
jgi:hypothetical protein